jgi:hypothetical protein
VIFADDARTVVKMLAPSQSVPAFRKAIGKKFGIDKSDMHRLVLKLHDGADDIDLDDDDDLSQYDAKIYRVFASLSEESDEELPPRVAVAVGALAGKGKGKGKPAEVLVVCSVPRGLTLIEGLSLLLANVCFR